MNDRMRSSSTSRERYFEGECVDAHAPDVTPQPTAIDSGAVAGNYNERGMHRSPTGTSYQTA